MNHKKELLRGLWVTCIRIYEVWCSPRLIESHLDPEDPNFAVVKD